MSPAPIHASTALKSNDDRPLRRNLKRAGQLGLAGYIGERVNPNGNAMILSTIIKFKALSLAKQVVAGAFINGALIGAAVVAGALVASRAAGGAGGLCGKSMDPRKSDEH